MEPLPSKIRDQFEAIFEPELLDEIMIKGRLVKLKSGSILVDIGQTLDMMPLMLNGFVRILRENEQGHELFLYYLQPGDTCAMSLVCCMQTRPSEIRAVVEEDSILWLVPKEAVDSWMGRFNSWRAFVFKTYHLRFDELLDTIDSIAFLRMDERLMKYLLDLKQSKASYVIAKTHQEIANDLNTSRVVISRLLKQLEKEEKIEMYRNRIEIL